MRPHSISRLCIIALLFAAGSTPGIAAAAEPEPLRVLFLGDRGHHEAALSTFALVGSHPETAAGCGCTPRGARMGSRVAWGRR